MYFLLLVLISFTSMPVYADDLAPLPRMEHDVEGDIPVRHSDQSSTLDLANEILHNHDKHRDLILDCVKKPGVKPSENCKKFLTDEDKKVVSKLQTIEIEKANLLDEWRAKNKGAKEDKSNELYLAHLIEEEAMVTEKELAVLKGFCRPEAPNPVYCLTEQEIKDRQKVKLKPALEKPDNIPAEAKALPAVAPVPDEKVALNNEPVSYDIESCKWSEELPRRIVAGPDCPLASSEEGPKGTLICTGHIVCDQKVKNKPKYLRLATCSSVLCGKDDAVKCLKQPGYGSTTALDENKSSPGQKVQDAASKAKASHQ
ncbi:MAG TPA: hypothetical protein VNJ08_04545 [Bacteriovoracaceae bacterium]|nr:hypothetical protein [Bacteriovoracaceae bacterium]